MRQLVPTANEVPALLEQVSTAARQTGLDISGVTPLGVIPGDVFDTYRYRVGVTGSYHRISQFLNNVGCAHAHRGAHEPAAQPDHAQQRDAAHVGIGARRLLRNPDVRREDRAAGRRPASGDRLMRALILVASLTMAATLTAQDTKASKQTRPGNGPLRPRPCRWP